MQVTEIEVYKSIQAKLGDREAQELVGFIKSEIKAEFMDCKQVFLVKEDKIDLIQSMKQDKVDLIRAIFISGIIQFLAIIGALLGILSFFTKH